MVQIFRIDNPFFKRGLSFMQRLCYANAILHFLYGFPRFFFMTSPLAYLFLEVHVIDAPAGMIAVFALPHLIMSSIAIHGCNNRTATVLERSV
jgi:cellulose synthase (UDP-forming)